MISEEIIFLILIGFGILVSILFVLDIYFSTKVPKRKEKKLLTLEFSEELMNKIENAIFQEFQKSTAELSKKILTEIVDYYKKEILNFSQRAEKKILELEEILKREILKTREISVQGQEWLKNEIKKTIEEVNKDLTKKTDELYKIISQNLKEKISQLEKEIENYKKEKIREIDRKVYQLLGEVAKKTIGRIIDISEHEELVWQALEKAKKEKFF